MNVTPEELIRLVAVITTMTLFAIVVVADVVSESFSPDPAFYYLVGIVLGGVMGIQALRGRNGRPPDAS